MPTWDDLVKAGKDWLEIGKRERKRNPSKIFQPCFGTASKLGYSKNGAVMNEIAGNGSEKWFAQVLFLQLVRAGTAVEMTEEAFLHYLKVTTSLNEMNRTLVRISLDGLFLMKWTILFPIMLCQKMWWKL